MSRTQGCEPIQSWRKRTKPVNLDPNYALRATKPVFSRGGYEAPSVMWRRRLGFGSWVKMWQQTPLRRRQISHLLKPGESSTEIGSQNAEFPIERKGPRNRRALPHAP